jgi:galacturan 1,4-alpha-galacturonidase
VIAWKDFTLHNTKEILSFSQCTSFSRQKGDCDTSKFRITDFTFSNIKGTSNSDVMANLQCSAAAPCEKIRIERVDVRTTGTKEGVQGGKRVEKVGCRNVRKTEGFSCAGDITKNGNGS